MSPQNEIQPIIHSVTVGAPIEDAFVKFTGDLNSWWPKEYTWAGENLDTIGILQGIGGRCYERDQEGDVREWGRVLIWDPPQRLVFSWQIGPEREFIPDPANASEVEVRFIKQTPTHTRIELTHSGFSRHGKEGEKYRDMLNGPEGWTYILGLYSRSFNQ